MRRNLIFSFRNNFLKIFPNYPKDDATELAMSLEQYILTQTRPSLTDYKSLIGDYEKLIEKIAGKPFLVNMLAVRPIPQQQVS